MARTYIYMTPKDKKEAKNLIKYGVSRREVSKMYDVSLTTINNLVTGKHKKFNREGQRGYFGKIKK